MTAEPNSTHISFLPVRGGRSGRLAVLRLLAAGILVAALSVPSAFILARKASLSVHDAHRYALEYGGAADHAPDRLDGNPGKSGGEELPAPKRPKGFSHSTGKVGNGFAVLASIPNLQVRLEVPDLAVEPTFDQTEIGSVAPPPHLLERPPPEI